jgi:beta-aspartyl-peptidase (threonine type)
MDSVSQPNVSGEYVLAIHGGAGTITADRDAAPYHVALKQAAAAGEFVLAGGGSALDAVVAAVVALEDCHLFNAGRGSVYTSDWRQEMDAIVMDGARMTAGAVTGVHTVKHPVLLACAVMEQTSCVMLAGEGAERFAREAGFPVTAPEYFASPARLEQLRQAKAAGNTTRMDHDSSSSAPIDPDTRLGTVGAVARDRLGNLASAVSTGGLTNKRPGRVGDTPIVGAGCYADNRTVAVAATGSGEHIMRAVLARDIAARMEYAGATLEQAAHLALQDRLKSIGGIGGVIAIDRAGNMTMPFTTSGMYRASVRENEAIVSAIFRDA